jgi:glutamate N-acetyltransferase/amino-acid N-acetyltransferase
MEGAMPSLKNEFQSDSLLPFARAIMTTDAWPKVRRAACGEGSIVATAKGAGMIEPDMATMLAFFLTDVDIPRDVLRRILVEEADLSFNRVSIDGETSTSDTVLMFSSRRRPYPGEDVFRRALRETASSLSEDVVRNGEGTAHVFRVSVSGAPDTKTAVKLARSVVNAPLTKTAVFGNDPNVGRVLQALGAACGRMSLDLIPDRLTMDIGGIRVFGDGVFRLTAAGEKALSSYFKSKELPIPTPGWPLHEERAEIELNLGCGDASAWVTGSDLSGEYVIINADYRT